jgi:hypothetical protein
MGECDDGFQDHRPRPAQMLTDPDKPVQARRLIAEL